MPSRAYCPKCNWLCDIADERQTTCRCGYVFPTQAHWSWELYAIGACSEAKIWAATQSTSESAWASCHRADWPLWIAARKAKIGSDEHNAVVLVACACARTALKFVPEGEKRPLAAIETAERWARGEATLDEVREARRHAADAYAAADAAADAYAAAAADAAAYAYAAADAAADAYAAADARSKALREMADLVRSKIQMPRLGSV